jgi:hypothetical protein
MMMMMKWRVYKVESRGIMGSIVDVDVMAVKMPDPS